MAADVHNAKIALLGHHQDCHRVRNYYNKMIYNTITSLTCNVQRRYFDPLDNYSMTQNRASIHLNTVT